MNIMFAPGSVGRPERNIHALKTFQALPLERLAAAMPWPVPSSPLAVRTNHHAQVLVVDDDESLRVVLADLLQEAGFCVVQAGDAKEALMILRANPSINGLVTDLSMPGLDGVALIHQARELSPNLPAILMTGYADHAAANATSPCGHFLVLRKPVQGECLIEHLELMIPDFQNVPSASTEQPTA